MNMKYFLFVCFLFVGLLSACQDDAPDTSKSIFETTTEAKNEFDKWLQENYVDIYNVDYKYRMDDIELDYSKNLAPSEIEQSMRLAKIIKHVWLEAYVETAGDDFMRNHAPAILQVIGSASWNNDGTITLGTAEGGLKITLYMTNWLNPKDVNMMNEYFFKTMHHEFTHILQQDVNYPQEYNMISAEDYRPSGWVNRRNLSDYAPLGFITPYAGSMAVEDITELTCTYVTFTDQQWNAVFNAAGDAGRDKLNQKVGIMKRYMQEVWNIDMDKLKQVVRRRMSEVDNIQLLEPTWQPLIGANASAITSAALHQLEKELRAEWKDALKNMEENPHVCHIHNVTLMDILQANSEEQLPIETAQ